MLPEAKDEPSAFVQGPVHSAVSGDVLVELAAPPSCVRFRRSSVKGTSVPVASVDEHHDSILCPDDVTTHPQVRLKACIDAIPKTCCVQPATDLHLRLGIPAT